MKVLVLSNFYPPDVKGGYELGCKQAVDALRGRGHDVHVLTTAPRVPVPRIPSVLRRFQAPDVLDHYLFHHSRPVTAHLAQADSLLVSSYNVHVLLETIAELEPDVVYVWMITGIGGLGLMAALRHVGMPWVWHLMDDVPLMLGRLSGNLVAPLIRELDRQLDGDFLACSQILIDEIEAGGINISSQVEAVPNWVAGPRPPAREACYAPAEGRPLKVMAASQIAPHKGIEILIDAAKVLVDQGQTRFQVDIFGQDDGPHFSAYAMKIRQLGLEQHVCLAGARSQSQLARLYPRYDLFAFPTWAREPFGFAPLEAAWTGCVPLISQACGIAEWLVHGIHCLKAERSPQAFAEVMGSVIEGSTDLSTIAKQAAAVVDRDFHINTIISRIEAALTRALSRPRRPAGSPADAYRMALLAEKLTRVMVQEAIPA